MLAKKGKFLIICFVIFVTLISVYVFIYTTSKGKHEKIIIVLDDEALVEEVKVYLTDYKIIICNDSIARILRPKIYKVLFNSENISLPLAILIKENKVIGVIIGLPSEALWKRILDYATADTPFIAYSGFEEIFTKCPSCSEYRVIEWIEELPENTTRMILSIINQELKIKH